MTAAVKLPDGFHLERLYQVPRGQGSWVAMTADGGGGLFCADQHGSIYRVVVATDGAVAVDLLGVQVKGAHGLLWHRGVLWVAVGERLSKNGVWRIDDKDSDGKLDEATLVKEMRGTGEHSVHSLVAAPDGESIYVVAGNHTDLPEMDASLVPQVWREDHLLPRNPDARGHARGRMAPGGWIARFKPGGSQWELFSIGYRNPFDAAFNVAGDLITYDSDMEWDMGMPWYRPTRFCQVLPGSEFGWRNGTGKWPAYYEDSLPGMVDIGPGSPTGMVSGKGAKFPDRYQRAVFGFDWTFATIYALHMVADGAGYRAKAEEFLTGTKMPLTDGVVGGDGALYFLTGGRKVESALWRVGYRGSEAVGPVVYQSKPLELMGLEQAQQMLSSADRLERYAARTALERLDPEVLRRMLGSDKSDAWGDISAALGLARVGSVGDLPLVMDALCRHDWATLDTKQQLAWLRALAVVASRHSEGVSGYREKILERIDSHYAAEDGNLNRELCRVLCFLQAPGVVGRTLALMDGAGPTPPPDWLDLAERNSGYGKTVKRMLANMPPEQVIHYAYCLRVVKGPWTDAERKRFFDWLAKLSGSEGGRSYSGFIRQIERDTLSSSTDEERKYLESVLAVAAANPFANLPPIEGPGRQWSVEDVVELAKDLNGADAAKGNAMYRGALCAACHRFGGQGGSVGPDLTNLSGRFSARDIAVAILEPSETVSDQFAFDVIELHDGSSVVGKIVGEKDLLLLVATNPYDMTQTIEIEASAVKGMKPSPVSPMPPGLIHRMNADELKALLAYLLGSS